MTPDLPADRARWAGRVVLVTGAGGFIGSHLVERLVGLGATVRAFVRYNSMARSGWLDASPVRDRVTVLAGDVADRESVRRAMRGADTVFHLAALIGIPYSYDAPGSYVETNVVGTLHVLQSVLEFGARRMVHTSTSEVYGTARYVPIDEDHPLQGQSPYSATKIGADKLAEAFWRSFGAPVVVVRPFNTFGPRQSARAVIPTVITHLLAGGAVRLGSLTPRRDLTFVADTVEGLLAAAEAEGVEGQVVNLGTGTEVAIGDLAHRIASLMGSRLEVLTEEARVRPSASEVDRLLSDNRRARALLGWAPRWSLDEGLRDTIAWFRTHQNLYRSDGYVV